MAIRPSYFRERARNPYLKARPPAPGLEGENPNASPADFLATSPRRAVAPPSAFDPAQAALAILPAIRTAGATPAPGEIPGAAPPPNETSGSLAFLPPMLETGERYRAEAPPAAPLPPDPMEVERGAFMAGTPATTKGRILQALANAGLGALQAAGRDRENPLGAALGGAAAGGLISGISPRTGRAFQFETLQRPAIEDRLRREEAARKKQQDAEDRALKRRETEADIGYKGAQIRELGSRPEIARENARRQAAIAESQVALNNARAEAARTGTPTYVDIDEGGGKITKYQVFPNGTARPVGASGAAAISRANIKSREGIAARREAGANARAARREAGRQSKKVATIDDIDAAVKASGLSELEVKKRFIEKGYRIIEE